MDTITIKDVARMCGVGVTTVSKAINNHNGLDLNKRLVWCMKDCIEGYSMESGYAVTKELLKSEEEFTALYDISFYYNPSITTIRQPVEEIAKETIKILFDLIQNKTVQTHKIFPAELVVRDSTETLL